MTNILKLIILFLLCGVVFLTGCNSSETNLKDGDEHINKEMNKVISDYIVQNYSTSFFETEKQFEVHKVYGTSESEGIINVYMWSYYGGFNKSTGTEIQSGQSNPAVIRLRENNETYTVIEYIVTQDGESWLSSLKEMFPKKYVKLAKRDSGKSEYLQKEMDKKVKRWLETRE